MSFLSVDVDLAKKSYYAATVERTQRFPKLEESVGCDVAVVGGGLAGLSAAIELADRGYSVVVLEAKEVGWGASGRNGGQALAGLACDQATIEAQVGMIEARRIWAMTLEAIALIQERCSRFDIACDWQGGFLSLAVNERKAKALRQWQDHMQSTYAFKTQWIDSTDMPAWIASPRFHSGVFDPTSGHLNPLKYSLGLARAAASLGVKIFEHSAVQALTQGETVRLKTEHGEVRACDVLLAGNVYLQGLAPVLQPRIMPVGTYIVTSEMLDPTLALSLVPSKAAVCDTNFVLDYFRPTPDHRMLYGGRVSYSTSTPHDLEASMQKRMATTFPQLKNTRIEYSWGGFVDISMNRAPDFGRLKPVAGSGSTKGPANVYYLQGFSGHGLALTGLAGKLVAEAIDGNAKRFDTFSRLKHRSFPGGKLLRTPALVAGMAYYRLRDML
jgi:gamma-glutamylputrescine oxidase